MSMFPLWEPTNHTVFSSVFNVPVGYCCILHATDFKSEKYRDDAATFIGPQVVCVKRLVHGFKARRVVNLQCDWIFDIDNSRAEEVVDQIVQTCDGTWTLSACNNIGIIGVPGSYRLELNDPTAIGVAQVYAELVKVSELPSQISNLFFL